ncbi:MAG: hypothetical protein ACOYH4_01570 [Saccharofermentanales bacterium]|jgi:hypothetical protein
MSRRVDGNLARQMDVTPYPMPDIEVAPHPDEIAREKAEMRRRLQRDAVIREEYKLAGKARAKTAVRLFAVVFAVAFAVGLIVWRSAKMTEMSFVNAGLKRQIGEYERQNSILHDRVSSQSSLIAVRESAASELGMQKATPGQIIYVPAAMAANDGTDLTSPLFSKDDSIAQIEQWVRGR